MDMDDTYAALSDADAACDAEALAEIGWKLYGELGTVSAELRALRALCHEVPRAPGRRTGYQPRSGSPERNKARR
jgi:hypothetical protein